MKEKFLTLVNEVKATGIAVALRNATNASEFTEIEQKFSDENKKLVGEILDWAEEYKDSESEEIFAEEETIENPMEIAIILRIINDEAHVSECEIFENYSEFTEAIRDIGDDFSAALAELIECDYICDITAEQIFDAIFDSESEF